MRGPTDSYMLDVQAPPDLANTVQQLAQQFVSAASILLSAVDSTVIDIARLAYVTVLLVGALLYFTRLERRTGKDLIKGGLVLAVLSELVFPQLNRF